MGTILIPRKLIESEGKDITKIVKAHKFKPLRKKRGDDGLKMIRRGGGYIFTKKPKSQNNRLIKKRGR